MEESLPEPPPLFYQIKTLHPPTHLPNAFPFQCSISNFDKKMGENFTETPLNLKGLPKKVFYEQYLALYKARYICS